MVKQNNTSNLAINASLNLPPAGTVMWGRIKYSRGMAIRVEGYRDGMAVVLHQKSGHVVKMLPATLIHAYRAATPSDPQVSWSSEVAATDSGMTGNAAPTTNGRHRSEKGKRATKSHFGPCDPPTVMATISETVEPDNAPTGDVNAGGRTDAVGAPCLGGFSPREFFGLTIHVHDRGAAKPLILSSELGRHLGHARDRNASQTIRSMMASGKLVDVLVTQWVDTTRMPSGGNRQLPREALWLNEDQASLVAEVRRVTNPRPTADLLAQLHAAFSSATSATAQNIPAIPHEEVAHFGPDRLPEVPPETVDINGVTVGCYRSRKDGSLWVPSRAIVKICNKRKEVVVERANSTKPGENDAQKVTIFLSAFNRPTDMWLYSVPLAKKLIEWPSRRDAINEPTSVEPAQAIVEVPHFGPDPLPMKPHKELALSDGTVVRLYQSQRDGSHWGVLRDMTKALRLHFTTIRDRAKKLPDGQLLNVDIQGPNNRILHDVNLASLDALKSWLHPDATMDAAVAYREETKAAAAQEEPVSNDAKPSEPARSEPPAEPDEADGDVPDGVAIVRVDGVSLVVPGSGETDHKVRDVDLARFIGFSRLRKFRETIDRYESNGDLNGVDWRPCEGRQSTGNGGVRIFKVRSAFLTMDQALFVVAKSDSPSANALTRHIISVFLKVQRQGGVAASSPSMDQMMATMAQIAGRAASEAARETVSLMLAEFRNEQARTDTTVDEKTKRDAEELRRREESRKRKAEETRRMNLEYPTVQKTFLPLVVRFLNENFDPIDLRDPAQKRRSITAGKARDMFVEWMRRVGTHIPPHNRHISRLLNECGNGVRSSNNDEHVLLPWALKISVQGDPRQTTIPGSGR